MFHVQNKSIFELSKPVISEELFTSITWTAHRIDNLHIVYTRIREIRGKAQKRLRRRSSGLSYCSRPAQRCKTLSAPRYGRRSVPSAYLRSRTAPKCLIQRRWSAKCTASGPSCRWAFHTWHCVTLKFAVLVKLSCLRPSSWTWMSLFHSRGTLFRCKSPNRLILYGRIK